MLLLIGVLLVGIGFLVYPFIRKQYDSIVPLVIGSILIAGSLMIMSSIYVRTTEPPEVDFTVFD